MKPGTHAQANPDLAMAKGHWGSYTSLNNDQANSFARNLLFWLYGKDVLLKVLLAGAKT
jgi:hypothetical protein